MISAITTFNKIIKKEDIVNPSLTAYYIPEMRYKRTKVTTKKIAVKKHIRFHRVMIPGKNIFHKLGVSISPALFMYAINSGLLEKY